MLLQCFIYISRLWFRLFPMAENRLQLSFPLKIMETGVRKFPCQEHINSCHGGTPACTFCYFRCSQGSLSDFLSLKSASKTAIVTASLLEPSLWSGTSCRTARHCHSNGRGLDSCSPGTAITNQQQTLVPSLLVLRSLLTSVVRPLLANLWTGCKMETCRLSVHLWGSSSVSIYSI